MCDKSTSDTIPYGYCHCGCGQTTKIARAHDMRYGTVKGTPLKFINGHNRRRSTFGPEYVIDPDSGCWNWTGKLDENGYGHVSRKQDKLHSAHRFIYQRHKGEIPEGLILDHLCRNPQCVNPEHLEPVTYAVNARRGNLAKLTPKQVEEIKLLIETTPLTNFAIAEMYGVSYSNISKIRRGWTWQDQPIAKRSAACRSSDNRSCAEK